MKMKRLGAVGALVAAGLVLGYLFGPPLVNAAGNAPATTSDVHIKDDTNSYKANVTSTHKLSVDTEAAVTDLGDNYLDTFGYQGVYPDGDLVIGRGTGSATINACGVVAGVVVDGATGDTVTLKEGTSIDWQGTLGSSGGHLNDTFDGGIYFTSNISVTTTGTDEWIVYGFQFPCGGSRAAVHGAIAGR